MSRETVLVRVSGPDRPGITAGLMGVLADAGATVQDIEQVVVRQRLTLAMVVQVPAGRDVLKELLLFGWEHEVSIDFEVVEPDPVDRPPASVVTVIGRELGPRHLAAVAGAIADAGGNIDRIVRMSRYPVVSYDLEILGGDLATMQERLVAASGEHHIDVAVQRAGLHRRAKRLVVLDLDSTLIQDEMIDLLAEECDQLDQVAAITARAMEGELDFEQSLRARTELLAGVTEDQVLAVRERIRFTPGARTFVRTLHRLGYQVGVISGGFTIFTDHVAELLNLDHARANELEFADGVLTGRIIGDLVDRTAKADLLRAIADEEGIPLGQTVAIGDGANDIDMLATAGLGIAFNAKPAVRDAAEVSISVPYLDVILSFLGVSREEIEDADRDDPEARPASAESAPALDPA
ncbi:MAG: phosphoserine phosphatase SerB [Actinomycetota bacterium]